MSRSFPLAASFDRQSARMRRQRSSVSESCAFRRSSSAISALSSFFATAQTLFCGKTLSGPAWFTSFRLRLRGARQIFALPSSLRDSRLRRSSFTACSPHSKTPFTMAPAACSQSRTEHGGSMGLVIDVEAEARPQRASALHWGRLLWWSGLLRPPFASNPPQPPPPFATKCWRPSGLS